MSWERTGTFFPCVFQRQIIFLNYPLRDELSFALTSLDLFERLSVIVATGLSLFALLLNFSGRFGVFSWHGPLSFSSFRCGLKVGIHYYKRNADSETITREGLPGAEDGTSSTR